MNTEYWKAKLLARIHDPGEKSFVLFGDRAGHEGGTVRALEDVLFGTDIDKSTEQKVKWADWWAAAADRPQWPQKKFDSQVRWQNEPLLIHPLSGESYDLGNFKGVDVEEIKSRSLSHFKNLIHSNNDGSVDYRRTCLAYWRFCSELVDDEDNNSHLGNLWNHLPADTRVPDHSIWDHLDLTAAFAGAFVGDQNFRPALLVVSIGPVQSFIASGRSTSDLWAASHMLSSFAWEAMKVICEQLGPDSIIFPRLRGIPIVDQWLDREHLNEGMFQKARWKNARTQESNPLFRASLPNRFVAIVPYSESERLTAEIKLNLRKLVERIGNETLNLLFEKAGIALDNSTYAHKQIKDQLTGFPEVTWAAVPFSLIDVGNKERQTQLSTERLQSAMAPFFENGGEQSGFLASEAWQVLQKQMSWEDGSKFYEPNPGILYPAIYDLAERALAATKNTRFFEQVVQNGWRCSITGDSEWLTDDKLKLEKSYRQQQDTLWARVSEKAPSLAKEGEHLGALAAIKRVWPTLFAKQVIENSEISRFVVSTHTMAISKHLENWLNCPDEFSEDSKKNLEDMSKRYLEDKDDFRESRVALPPKLLLISANKEKVEWAKRIPVILEQAYDDNDSEMLKQLSNILFPGDNNRLRLESYYALIKLDGDRMGQILSEGGDCAITYADSFHHKIGDKFKKLAESCKELEEYGVAKRAISPGRHISISASLNDFSLNVVPHIVERRHLGRVIYAGGDDVLAMVPVADLLSTMSQLRSAYSGVNHDEAFDETNVQCNKGFVKLPQQRNIFRMMGNKATASCGAVVAHHKAPLAVVLRELEASEKRAKNEGGRDAYSFVVMKRSGGNLSFTDNWDSFSSLKIAVDYLSQAGVSRRSVYGILDRLESFPENAEQEMLKTLIFDQMKAHQSGLSSCKISELSRNLAEAAHKIRSDSSLCREFKSFLLVAEFLSREVRNEPAQSE